MGRDSPMKSHSQVSKSDKIKDGIIEEKFQFRNNSPGKRLNECQSISDLYKDDSDTRTIEGYDKYDWKSYASDSDKEVLTQKNDQSSVSNDRRQSRSFGTFIAGTSRKDDRQDPFHVHSTTNKSGSDHKFEQTKHDSDISAMDVSGLEDTEKPSTKIDTRIFQKQDRPQEMTKSVASRLDKCSWHKESERENIDEKSSSNEDNDTVAADLSTSDIFREETEDIPSETSGSHCGDISIVQTSDTSASESEDTKDSSTEDDCNSDIEENNEDQFVFIVDTDGQQAPIIVIVNIVEANDQELPLVEDEDADIDVTEESVCEDKTDDELSGTDRPDIVSQQNKQLVVQPFYPSLDSTAPIDHHTTKHHMLTNGGYNTEIIGDTADLVVNNVQIEIPPIQGSVNPLLPVQNVRDNDDVDGQSFSDGQSGNDSTDSVEFEEAEDLPLSNSSFSMSLESPQVTGGSLIHSFSTSSEDSQHQYWNMLESAHEEMSDFTEESDSQYSEQSDYWLSSLSDLAANVDDQDDEHLDIT